jgi:hypothetical protein
VRRRRSPTTAAAPHRRIDDQLNTTMPLPKVTTRVAFGLQSVWLGTSRWWISPTSRTASDLSALAAPDFLSNRCHGRLPQARECRRAR